MEYNFSSKVESLLKKTGKTKKSLYDFLGMSMQGFDSMMKNNSFSAVRLAKVAEFFEIDISEFYGSPPIKPEDTSPKSFGDETIASISKSIVDEVKALFEEELRTKNQQIAGMQRMLETTQRMLESVLVGKREGAIVEPLFSGDAEFDYAFNEYRRRTLAGLNEESALSPFFKVGGTPLPYAGNTVITSQLA